MFSGMILFGSRAIDFSSGFTRLPGFVLKRYSTITISTIAIPTFYFWGASWIVAQNCLDFWDEGLKPRKA